MNLRRIEFILITGIYLFLMLLIYTRTANEQSHAMFYQIIGLTIFLTTISFICYLRPYLFGRGKIDWGIGATILLFILSWSAITWCYSNININNNSWKDNFFDSPSFPVSLFTFLTLFAYEGIKTWFYYFSYKKETLIRKIAKEAFIVVISGALLTFISFGLSSYLAYLTLAIPYGYCLYALQQYLLLEHLESGKLNRALYTIFTIISAILTYIPFASIIKIASGARLHNEIILTGLLISIMIIPLTYILYFNQRKQSRQLVNLRNELGQTESDLKLLQSQINPHFLFNVMNTIYGIALQEYAERTAEGIQKLGDMMRFMLHENQQDSILLAREIEYLKEYIDLQTLRTAPVEMIKITYEIPEVLESHAIAPMLLIPFIENAFKHGISLNKPSWIRIHLNIDKDILKLSVYNSIHRLNERDPESNKSGLGLDNVKHRLNLLYQGNYELHIEETPIEFFTFLTLKIGKNSTYAYS